MAKQKNTIINLSSMEIPEDLKKLLTTIRQELPRILGDNLFGIYIYGSLSYGDFEENRSDVDLIAIVRNDLSEAEIDKLKKWYATDLVTQCKWVGALEMDYFVFNDVSPNMKNQVKTTRFAGGELRLQADFHGASMDWLNVKDCGITLYGPSPEEFLLNITDKLLLSALYDKFDSLKEGTQKWINKDLWNQMFFVIQYCRVVYTLREGKSVSKRLAAKWCSKHLPEKFRPMVVIALQKIDDFDGPLEEVIANDLPAFIDYIEELFVEKYCVLDSRPLGNDRKL